MMSKHLVVLNVNGKRRQLQVESHERLLDVLRNRLDLMSVKDGCGTGDCGACVVILNGRLVNSCLMLAVQARNAKIQTLEGLGNEKKLHPLQKAFIRHSAAQCGYCTPAMILTAKNLLEKNQKPSREEIRNAISGSLCRCTGYVKIVDAIQEAAAEMRGETVG
jgi:carbon-monoxide dehydrogenase small subunit